MGQDPNQQNPGQYGQPGGTPPPQGNYPGGYQQQQGAYTPPPSGGYQQPPSGYQQPPYGQSGYQQPYGQQAYSVYPNGPTSMNMDPNVAAGLSYLAGWVTGLIFFLVEKQNRFVRFHAMQSILLAGAVTVLEIALSVINGFLIFTFIGCLFIPLISLLGLAFFVLWLVCMINAFQGRYFKLPIIGDMAERYANSGTPGM